MKALAYCRNPEKKKALCTWELTPEQVEEVKEEPRRELMLNAVAIEAEQTYGSKFKLPVLILFISPEKPLLDQVEVPDARA